MGEGKWDSNTGRQRPIHIQIIAALPELTKAELQDIGTRIAMLAGAGKGSPACKEAWPLIQGAFRRAGQHCPSWMPAGVLSSSLGKRLEATLVQLRAFIVTLGAGSYTKGITIRLLGLCLEWRAEIRGPLGLFGLVDALEHLSDVLEWAFPGYEQAGFLPVALGLAKWEH